MATRTSSFEGLHKGENTAVNPRIGLVPRIVIPALKLNYALLVPLIVTGLPSGAILGQGIPIILVLTATGLAGMITRNVAAASFTSVTLLGLIIWGRVVSHLGSLGGFDTALLLLEFFLVIFFMEASNTAILFDKTNGQLKGKNDEISYESRARLIGWARSQLIGLGKVMIASFLLSLSLLVIGDLVSVSVNQIVFSATLVIVAVVALLVLVTYGREPKIREKA